MALSWAELEDRIRKLTRDYRDRGDRIYSVSCECGMLLGVTKVGRHQGSKKDVGPSVVGLIPRQLKIDAGTWRDIVGCTKSRSDYIRARGHAGCVDSTTSN